MRLGRTPWLVCVGIAGALLAFVLARRVETESIFAQFEGDAMERFTALEYALREPVWALDSMRALWHASREVEREEFLAFSRPLLRHHPMLSAVAWIPRVQAEGRVAFEEMARRTVDPAFAIHDPRGRESPLEGTAAGLHHPILYFEPRPASVSAVGLDLGHDPECITALQRAVHDGRACITPPRPLPFRAGGLQESFAFLPVYPRGTDVERDGAGVAPEGYVAVLFIARILVERAMAPLAELGISIGVTDATPGAPHFRIYPRTGPVPEAQGSLPLVSLEIKASGRVWSVSCAASTKYEAERRGFLPWVLLLGGLLFTGLSGLLVAMRDRHARELSDANGELARESSDREMLLGSLRTQETLLRLFIASTPAAVAMFDREMRCLAASGRWRRDLRIGDREPAGLLYYDLFPGQADDWRAAHKRCLAGAVEQRENDPLRHPDGTVDWVRWEVRPWRHEDGAIGGVVMFAEVVTQRRRAEEERDRIQLRLLETQKMEGIGVLAGGIAHDFNNLLTTILGFASIAQREASSSPRTQEALRQILAACDRAAALTRQLLAYAGRGTFESRVVDLAALLRETADLVRTSLPAHVTVTLELAADVPAVAVDPSQIQQLVMNLLLNATESCGPVAGRVVLRLGFEQVDAARIATLQGCDKMAPGLHARVEIEDDGSGMDEETRARIFDPFFTTKLTGRGLGLAAALGIVRRHGGGLEVQSAPGKGSRFAFLLPGTREMPEAPPPPTPLARGRGTILVAEDEGPIRSVITESLEALGYVVLSAPDGAEAVRICRERQARIDLALLDLRMPGMGGERAAREIAALAPEIPALFMTGYDEKNAGAPEGGTLLRKPFTPEQLADAVREALARATPSPTPSPSPGERSAPDSEDGHSG